MNCDHFSNIGHIAMNVMPWSVVTLMFVAENADMYIEPRRHLTPGTVILVITVQCPVQG